MVLNSRAAEAADPGPGADTGAGAVLEELEAGACAETGAGAAFDEIGTLKVIFGDCCGCGHHCNAIFFAFDTRSAPGTKHPPQKQENPQQHATRHRKRVPATKHHPPLKKEHQQQNTTHHKSKSTNI